MKFWLVLLLLSLGALGCEDKEELARLARVEKMLLAQQCEGQGHDFQWLGYVGMPLPLQRDISRISIAEDGTVAHEEFDGPWRFQCRRCEREELIWPEELTPDMRRQVRRATGCWPKQDAPRAATSVASAARPNPGQVDWLIVAQGHTAAGSTCDRVTLAGTASPVSDAYVGCLLQVPGHTPVPICGYDGPTRACTVQPPLVAIPQAGAAYRIVLPTPL